MDEQFLLSLRNTSNDQLIDALVLYLQSLTSNAQGGQGPVGPAGTPGAAGKSNYQLAVDNGFQGTLADYLNSVKGMPGKSAYQVWLDAGGVGSELVFLASLQGASGQAGSPATLEWPCRVTFGTQLASDSTMPETPLLNTTQVFYGGQLRSIGDGAKDKDCYFSSNNGSTAKTIAGITIADKLFWVGANAGFNLDTSDTLVVVYRKLPDA